MIRSVEIPAGNTRMGCTPGGDCCDSCRSHKPATAAAAIPTARNMALRARMGETQCDRDGNCYTDGELTSAPLTTGRGCPPGVPDCGGGGISTTALYIGGAVLFVLLLEATSRRR